MIDFVDEAMVDVLGWRPAQMVGTPSTNFVHPEDQPSAIAAWFEMRERPGTTAVWRGRYRTASGGWEWVETENTNRLDDPGDPVVETTMRRINVDRVGMEEELRARQQLLSRLADAVPVGLFQFDADRQITFTNDRLLEMLGRDAAATCEAQFEGVASEDVPRLRGAFERVMSDRPVDGVELRLRPSGHERERVGHIRVLLMSLRPLTDEAGDVSGAIGSVSDVTESVELRRALEVRATTDGPTGCMNRQATMELLEVMLARNASSRRGMSVVFVDIDNFKGVNDAYGHMAGDAVLVEIADRIRGVIRENDRLGRIGGDEFLVICPEVKQPFKAKEIAERIGRALHARIARDGHRIQFQASVGVAWSDQPVSADAFVAKADRAMYRSKREGKGGVKLAG